MTEAEALDIVVARTGVERYRYLVLEHRDPQVRRDYAALMLRMAAEPDDRPTVAESLNLTQLVRQCPYRSTGAGCGCSKCALAGGAKRSLLECMSCVRRYG